MSRPVGTLAPGLIVSCQARQDNPLHGPGHMAAMALAAAEGGAAGIRANGPVDIAAIRAVTDLPLVGLWKLDLPDVEVAITPTLDSARAVRDAGADVVAVDATDRKRPHGTPADFIALLRAELGVGVFADVATLDEGIAAADAGAAYVATTLAGYTPASRTTSDDDRTGPDLALLGVLCRNLDTPVVAEGRFWTPDQVARAFDLGAYAVVVGTAITNPREITRRFVAALPLASGR